MKRGAYGRGSNAKRVRTVTVALPGVYKGKAKKAAAGAYGTPTYSGFRSGSLNARTGGFTGIEKKFVDYEYDGALVETVAGSEADPTTALCLSAVAIGNGESERDGRKIILKDIFVNGYIRITTLAGASAIRGGMVKVCLVLDTQTNGAQLNAEDVFIDPSNSNLDAMTFRNLQQQQRFKVLKQMLLTIVPTAGGGDGAVNDFSPITVPFRLAKQGLAIPVNHTGTDATIGSIADNSLHLIVVGSPPTMSPGNVRYSSRCRYVG